MRSLASPLCSTTLLSAMVYWQAVAQPDNGEIDIEFDGPPPGMLMGPGPVILSGPPGGKRAKNVPSQEAQFDQMMQALLNGPPGSRGGPHEKAMPGSFMQGGPGNGKLIIEGPPPGAMFNAPPGTRGSPHTKGREAQVDDLMQAMLGPMMQGGPGNGELIIEGPPPGAMFNAPPGMRGSPHTKGREAQVDDMMQAMLGPMMQGGPDNGELIIEGPPPGQNGAMMMDDGPDGDDGAEVVIEQDGDGPPRLVSGSGNQALLRDLLPGPLPGQRGPAPSHPFEDDAPDAMVLNMVQDVLPSKQKMLPALQNAVAASNEPGSCKRDADKHCKSATSQIHCLGKHANDISDKCKSDVGKSVPFVCSDSIDRFCDLLERSILSCLLDHQKDLKADCLDAVTATQRIVKKINAPAKASKAFVQKSAVGFPAAGAVHTGSSVKDVQTQARSNAPTHPSALSLVKANSDRTDGYGRVWGCGLLFMLVAYVFECTGFPHVLQRMVRSQSLEGTKLLNNKGGSVEMPKPDIDL